MSYPLEAKLRPAYEVYAALVSALAATAVLASPSTFMLTREMACCAAGVLACHALWRGIAAWRVLRYRLNLRRLQPYGVRADDIPCSGERLFLGRGFRWDQRHTQRLHEARLPENQYLLEPGIFIYDGRTKRRLIFPYLSQHVSDQ